MAARGGIDMEALSPRDANALPKRTNDLKVKATAQLKAAKEKDHPPPPPPQVIEPASSDRKDGAVYQVGKMLGKGGFAICYDGKHVETGKRYALKIVKSHMPVKMEQKFQTELQIHSKMRQENIVQFHRSFTFANCTYLVLELCPNGSLMDMVKRRKGLTEPEVRFYSVQIAGAIKYMHARGIIHRDLKMGNIFLDKDMNTKVGDFGLAALVVTGKDMQTIRRTTLCGTPNYIAPEILQKGKVGHDHMVDIWSLGIIMFAMLTSKPPFQSSTTDEIYRRARERDYDWPAVEQKYISQEARHLVASMLEDADRRPDPDMIVQHPFFTTGYMPVQADITTKLREIVPEQMAFYESATDLRLQERNFRNLRELSRQCGVGPWHSINRSNNTTSIWREIASEEKHGLTPIIPLAENIVYRAYDDLKLEQERSTSRSIALLTEKTEALVIDPASSAKAAAPSGTRVPPQSFAAQQRAQGRPPPTAVSSSRTQSAMSVPPTRPLASRSRSSKKDVPLTTSGAISVESHEQATKTTTRSTRTALPSSRTQPARQPATRLVSSTQTAPQPQPKAQTTNTSDFVTLFNPTEYQERVGCSRPDEVLGRLRKLQAVLDRVLNSRSMALIPKGETTPPSPKLVVKWVDYTNKFGLGYILSEGSAGCLLNSIATPDGDKMAMLPPACLLVHGAEQHISSKNDTTYADRHQIVPMTEGIYFYEMNGEEGMSRVRVGPDKFRVPVNPDGTVEKLGQGKDKFEHRKRERIVLWKKFANYMLQYSRDLHPSDIQAPVAPTITDPTATPDDLVTFYQRFGDVSVWYFCDGHMQFNFPDHTKIVLDAEGYWCHFWHLSTEAAELLAETGQMAEASLDDRTSLSYPLQTLLNFTVKSASRSASNPARHRPAIPEEKQGIPAANDFRRKIEFIRSVVKEWCNNGGIGNSDMSREGRLRWTGTRQTKNIELAAKHVWVTVGSRWGDARTSAWVDLRRPAELGKDIDETKKT